MGEKRQYSDEICTDTDYMSLEDRIIEQVEQHSIIYDTSNRDYKNRDQQNDAWNKIRDELKDTGLTVEALKKKWTSIKGSYRNSKKKPRSGSGAGRKKSYSRNLTFLDKYSVEHQEDRHSSFVDLSNVAHEETVESEATDDCDIYTFSESLASGETLQYEADDSISVSEFGLQTPTTSRPHSQPSTSRHSSQPSTSRPQSQPSTSRHSSQPSSSRPSSLPSNRPSSRVSSASSPVDSNLYSKIDNLLEVVHQNWEEANTRDDDNSVSLFCNSLKGSLQSLSLTNLILCQVEILQVIAKYMGA